MNNETKSFSRKLWPLGTTQFFGVFNDNAFKIVSIFAVIGKTSGSSDDAIFLSFLTVIYVLPFLLLPVIAGFLADRFLKRNVMLIAKIAEFLIMVLGAVAFFMFESWGMWSLVGVMFLMASQSAFFSPAFNSYLPEVFAEKDISKANGLVGLLTFLAIILGVGGGVILKGLVGNQLWICGLVFSFFSFCGMLAVRKALPGKRAEKLVKWQWNLFTKYFSGFKLLFKDRPVLFSILGEAFFLGLGTVLQALLVIFAKYSLNMENEIDMGLVQLAPAFGIGIGCYLAGRFSAGKVELGLIPFGAAGLSIFLLTTVFFTGSPISVFGHILYPYVITSLFFVGMSGGLFVIPLRAYQQQKTDQKTRGSLLANANVVCFSAILVAGLLMLYLTGGEKEGVASTGGFLPFIKEYCLHLDPAPIFLGMAVLTILVTVYTFTLIPEFAIRFAVVSLTHTLYKLTIRGRENIPEDGPGLIVSNHVSFVDGLLISAASSRMIRFLMHEDYYNFPLLRWFFKWMGFIAVPNPTKPKGVKEAVRRTREALENGDLVCVFPEGKLTRNGVMDQFKKGFKQMIPEDMDIPIIPVRLGMVWGSIFTYYYGKVKLRKPKELPFPVSVTIGKPVTKDISPFDLRQKISEIAAETEIIPRKDEKPLHSAFAKIAKKHPFRKTFFSADGEVKNNFSILFRSAIFSSELRKTTECKNVGILLPNTIITAIGVLGTLMADKVPAMLNFSASADVMDKAIAKAEIDCILTSKLFIRKAKIKPRKEMIYLEDLRKKISTSRRLKYILMCALLPRQELMHFLSPESCRDVSRDAVILFSSGSSGDPKGVVLSHHNINSNVFSFIRVMGWDPYKDSVLGNLPLFHSFGMTTNFWLPMMSGTKVVYMTNPLDGAQVGKTVAEHKLTILLATPTFLQTYMRKCTPEQLKSLRLTIVGAEKLRPEITEKFREMTGLETLEGFGCTELSPVVSINIAESIVSLGRSAGRPGSVGHAIPGVCVKIVDQNTGTGMPVGEDGLLMVKGPNVMQRYLNDPEKTAEVIKDGWYNTGDIAKLDSDGYIYITGRLSRFSKIGGEMVPHEMVENAIADLLKSEERVVAVAGAPDEKKGEKLVVLHTDISMEPAEIITKLREDGNIPNLWIPKKENFMKIDEMPLLGSGKLDLGKLKELILET